MTTPSQPTKPVLSPATFAVAVLRLAIATEDELAEWDKRLPAEMRRHYEAAGHTLGLAFAAACEAA